MIKVSKLVVAAVVNESLAVNLTELIIVARYFDFESYKPFKSIVVTLNDQTVDEAERFISLPLR